MQIPVQQLARCIVAGSLACRYAPPTHTREKCGKFLGSLPISPAADSTLTPTLQYPLELVFYSSPRLRCSLAGRPIQASDIGLRYSHRLDAPPGEMVSSLLRLGAGDK